MKEETRKLKPCPFCGHKAEFEQEEQEIPTGEDWYSVICTWCGGNSGWYMSETQVVTAWNSRV